MTFTEFQTFYKPALVRLKGEDWYDRGNSVWLAEALNWTDHWRTSPYDGRPIHTDNHLTNGQISLLQLLAGPHGKTIFKAYRIARGLE